MDTKFLTTKNTKNYKEHEISFIFSYFLSFLSFPRSAWERRATLSRAGCASGRHSHAERGNETNEMKYSCSSVREQFVCIRG